MSWTAADPLEAVIHKGVGLDGKPLEYRFDPSLEPVTGPHCSATHIYLRKDILCQCSLTTDHAGPHVFAR